MITIDNLECFKNSIGEIINTVLQEPMNMDLYKVKTINKNFIVSDITVIIGMIGDIKGQTYLSLTNDTAKKIACSMMGDMEMELENELLYSAVGELANMIMGNSCSLFANINIKFDITPPTLAVGESVLICSDMQNFTIPIISQNLKLADFFISIKSE